MSRAPVSSPTPTMWLTIVGKTEDFLSGSAIVPPLLTLSMTPAIAFSMTWLPRGLAGDVERLQQRHAGA